MKKKKPFRGKRPKPHRGHGRPAAKAPERAGAEAQGRLTLHRDGYGFVIPSSGAGGDIFIPPPSMGGAMHGDTVAVRVERREMGGRSQGRITRILRRAQSTVVGVFRAGPPATVQPIDERLREPIFLTREHDRPAPKRGAHRTLGATAKAPPADAAARLEPRDGQIVDVEVLSCPTSHSAARGRVIEILGDRDDFGVDVEIMIRKHHLPHRFPDAALVEAEALPAVAPPDELARRRDFRGLPIVTIDGETAKDFDDAVLVERRPGGGFQLQVHIADVSWYVQPGSALDQEARLRGTSVYFPDRAVPMLPPRLSSDLCSLRPGEDRLVMSCLMDLDPRGGLGDYWIGPGVIRSAARMTYTDFNRCLNGDGAARSQYAALVEGFERMAELAAVLREKRRARGAIDFDLPEAQIAFDEFGLMHSIVRSERNQAHRLIEEFMLAAAETVARHTRAAKVASVYRIHEMPELKKVLEFEEVAATFGFSLGLGPLPVMMVRHHGHGKAAKSEIPQQAKFRISPRHYQKLAEKIAGLPEERILSYLMLRSLKQARYSTENVGHFALATGTYTHFTSPIRRYPDLMLHRIVKELLAAGVAGEPLPGVLPGTGDLPDDAPADAGLEAQCREASESERRAEDAERELMEWKKVRFMERHVGDEFPALITHVSKQGLYIELTDMFIDGHIPGSSLGEDRFRYREPTHEWIGERSRKRYRLGDRIAVRVDRIDPVRQKIHFAVVQ